MGAGVGWGAVILRIGGVFMAAMASEAPTNEFVGGTRGQRATGMPDPSTELGIYDGAGMAPGG